MITASWKANKSSARGQLGSKTERTTVNSELKEVYEEARERRETRLSRKCHAKGGKRRQKCGKRQQMKEKAGCGNLPQLAEFVRLATPLARFGKVVRTASKQRVGSSSLPGRATAF